MKFVGGVETKSVQGVNRPVVIFVLNHGILWKNYLVQDSKHFVFIIGAVMEYLKKNKCY